MRSPSEEVTFVSRTGEASGQCGLLGRTDSFAHALTISFVPLIIMFCTFLSICAGSVSADDGADPTNTHQFLSPHLFYFREKDDQHLSIDDLIQLERNSVELVWQQSRAEVPSFGYDKGAYWFRWSAPPLWVQKIVIGGSYNDWVLQVPAPLLQRVDFYLATNGQLLHHQKGGYNRPSQADVSFSPYPVFRLPKLKPLLDSKKIESIQELTIYFRVQTSYSVQMPVYLLSEQAYTEQYSSLAMGYGLYLGLLLMLVLYHLFLFSLTRDYSFFYYTLTVSFIFLSQFIRAGLGKAFFPEAIATELYFFLPASILLTLIFGGLFIRTSLSIKSYYPQIDKLFQVVIGASILLVALHRVLPSIVAIQTALLVGLTICTFGFFLGLKRAMKRDRYAQLFTTGWGVLLIGGIILILTKFSLIPYSFSSELIFVGAILLDVIFLSLALGYKVIDERKNRIAYQHRLIQEIKSKQRAEEQLVYQTLHDRLSGLPNKTFIQQYIDHYFSSQLKSQEVRPLAIALICLTRFQEINNTLGHSNGDRLIREIALLLNEELMKVDQVLCLENKNDNPFVVAQMEGICYSVLFATEDEQLIVQGLYRGIMRFMEPYPFDQMHLDIGVAVGVTTYPSKSKNPEEILRHARIALDTGVRDHEAVTLYSEDINPYSQRRLKLMGELTSAIKNSSLVLYFQPQISLDSDLVIGFEALVRWVHPEIGFIPPDEFIPIAEQGGNISQLTAWVLKSAIEQMSWFNQLGFHFQMAVNLSAKDLRDPQLVSSIMGLLEKHKVQPSQLIVELTETTVIQERDIAKRVLWEMKTKGITVALDDFGTGYSSLSYLKLLPLDQLKIDRSFIRDIATDKDDKVLVQTMIIMSSNLGISTVAEGIEDKECMSILETYGCDKGQGFFIAKPLPLHDLIRWLSLCPFSLPGDKEKLKIWMQQQDNQASSRSGT